MKMAFSSIIAAFSVVLMMMTGMIPVASLAIPAIAGCLLIPVVIEAGLKWAFGAYAVSAVLCFFLTPDREAAIFYSLFFGYYPVLFAILGRIKKRWLQMLAKLMVFNAAMAAELLIATYILGLPVEQIGFLGKYTIAAFMVLLNVVFVIYDYALNGLIVLYLNKMHDKIRKLFK